MIRLTPRLLVGAALLLGVALISSTATRADDDPAAVKKAAEAVTKLADSLDGKDVAAQAKAIAKANDIEHVMHVFKPRNKGGLGVGVKAPPPGMKDSVELAIIDLATRKGPDAAALKANQADLIKLAQVSHAIAEINYNYMPPKKPGAKDSDWKQYTDDMKAGSKDLIEAVKAGDPVKVKAAANKLNGSCTDCHGKFRDS